MTIPNIKLPTEADYVAMTASLTNRSGKVPLAERFRTLFTLRAISTNRAVEIIGQAFNDSSALLGHELAYCLGQVGSEHALPKLSQILQDRNQHPMVRHEAAEAMGAISSKSSLPLLRSHLEDASENVSVRETCEIAIAKIEYDHGIGSTTKGSRSRYDSIDPAPPLSMHETGSTSADSIPALRATLLDNTLPLFARYRAMFALRNLVTALSDSRDDPNYKNATAAVEALAVGFSDTSALFRHEIAYIFGQLCSPLSVSALLNVLRNESEDEMVRHEAAEALGGIANDGGQGCLEVLREWAVRPDCPRVVRESCEVALDMWAWNQQGEFISVEDSIRLAAADGVEPSALAV